MKVNKLRELSRPDLNVRLIELKKELFELRMRNATNQLDNPMLIPGVKREIARVKTILRELEMTENVS